MLDRFRRSTMNTIWRIDFVDMKKEIVERRVARSKLINNRGKTTLEMIKRFKDLDSDLGCCSRSNCRFPFVASLAS
ncbi:uncharacterized protein PGTG_05768 [Puccinia graminis f. sp. tritici CRL 75-36-700-3]|uniref:Uncharacterized protein n=1 Tax=Puccinia graminis f. sp. tritici (strain CRL 75-36-700-3 / race SCCL) TaxID=418459 RepID=E3K5G1_PUCGT|nr:uncharacterized protein PGTG_05768 [Puccinia graminis f. sp. tritici CRL 75-36-700-3]EFP79447.2 hypothetical protein PGTG_05768 [Puccinia graminis f. sp. tritici CRL 75-36-700-3]